VKSQRHHPFVMQANGAEKEIPSLGSISTPEAALVWAEEQ